MRAAWINLGSTYMLLDDYGDHRGMIITLENQTHQQSLRSLYEPPVVVYTEWCKILQNGVINRKTA